MEGLFVPLMRLLMENPEWSLFVEVLVVVMLGVMWKYTQVPMKKKINKLETDLCKHHEDSVARGAQIEQTKDTVSKIEGMLSIMSISASRSLK